MTTTNGSLVLLYPRIDRSGNIHFRDRRTGRVLMVLSRQQVAMLYALMNGRTQRLEELRSFTRHLCGHSAPSERLTLSRSLARLERNRLVTRPVRGFARATRRGIDLFRQLHESGILNDYFG